MTSKEKTKIMKGYYENPENSQSMVLMTRKIWTQAMESNYVKMSSCISAICFFLTFSKPRHEQSVFSTRLLANVKVAFIGWGDLKKFCEHWTKTYCYCPTAEVLAAAKFLSTFTGLWVVTRVKYLKHFTVFP